MERVALGHGTLLACGKDLDLRATDVVVVGRGVDHLAIVALGNEGVLRGRLDADWSRHAVGSATPTSERGGIAMVLSPSIIFEETAVAVLAAAAAMLALSYLAWRCYGSTDPNDPPRSDAPWKTGVILTLLVLILMFALDVEALIPYAVVPLVGFMAWVVVLWTGWLRTFRADRDSKGTWTALVLCLLGSVLVGLALWIPFALWVLGTIPAYTVAVLLAVAAAAGVFAGTRSLLVRRRSQPESEPVT
jgi:hypothetical protein